MSRFCVAPWLNLEVSMLGTCRVCCHIGINAKTGADQELHFGTDPIENIWHAKSLQDLRQSFINGEEPKACNSCWSKEQHGGTSTRQSFNHWYETRVEKIPQSVEDWSVTPETGPRSFGMHPGNVCSLKCRMCSPVKSSKIAADKVATEWADKSEIHKAQRLELSGYRRTAWWKNDTFIEEFVSNMEDGPKRLFIAGGEPFITPWVNYYITRLAKRPDAGKIIVQLYTNGQDLPPDLGAYGAFEKVILNVSLEAHGPLNDYIRDLSKWEDVEKNLEVLNGLKNGSIVVSPSLQMYNMLALADLVRWGVKRGWPAAIGYVADPYYLDAIGAPPAVREEGAKRLYALAGELSAPGHKNRWSTTVSTVKAAASRLLNPPARTNHDARMRDFWKFTEEIDAARSQSLADVAPELFDGLKAWVPPVAAAPPPPPPRRSLLGRIFRYA